ncbi:serine/threonine-protein kinase pim-2-like [Carassius carassius]|uniref:serine/threonine-protein kinase pim-2-like n=1 Tax=Carassius carassius TaxID=217509 RepID=UPI002868FCD5|nr:serine/threonine-protein kinase pim-2-like [Carassius carassius]
MENNPTEKQRKNKKSGICAFFKRTWQAVKCVDRCHHRENQVRPFQPEADPADLQHASSGLESMAFPDLDRTDPNADPADPEPAKEKQPKIQKKGIFAFVKRTLRGVKCATKQNNEEPVAPQPNTDSGPSEAAEQKPCSPGRDSADLQSPGQSDPSQVSFASLYEVRTKISSGGFGTVFRGIHRSDDQEVAIKFIPKRSTDQYIRRAGYPKPLLMEVALNLLLKKAPISPNIVYMLEWFEEEDQHILIMEYPQPCHNIKTLLKYNRHKLDETPARSLMLQAVLAAKHCIDQGVFHRDIKLNNLLLNTRTMEVKLIDFGCGDLVKTSGYQYEFRGRYRPPEYYTKHKYHAGPTTVWTLGLALFRMVTGHHAFQTEKDILAGNLTFDSSLSRECQDVISRCLIRDPDDRATLQQLLDHRWFKQEDDPAVAQESDESNDFQ